MKMPIMMTKEYCRRNGFKDTCPHCEGSGTVWQTDEVKLRRFCPDGNELADACNE